MCNMCNLEPLIQGFLPIFSYLFRRLQGFYEECFKRTLLSFKFNEQEGNLKKE
jgi:hypothetical protein